MSEDTQHPDPSTYGTPIDETPGGETRGDSVYSAGASEGSGQWADEGDATAAGAGPSGTGENRAGYRNTGTGAGGDANATAEESTAEADADLTRVAAQELEEAVRQAFEAGGGDLVCVTGQVPMYQVQGFWQAATDAGVMEPNRLRAWANAVLGEEGRREFDETGEAVVARAWGDPPAGRLRATVRTEARGLSLAIRMHPLEPPAMAALRVPQPYEPLLAEPGGLIVIGGPSASGRSTLLASSIHQMATTSSRRIAYIGAPPEFTLPSRQSTVFTLDPREKGRGVGEILQDLRLHDIDVVAIDCPLGGEDMFDAIAASQAGTLVLLVESGMAAKHLLRSMIDRLPAERRRLALGILAESLRGVIIQSLVRRRDGQGRMAAHELLLQARPLGDPLREARWDAIPKIMTTARPQGMRLLDDTLEEYMRQNWITGQEAFQNALDKTRFLSHGPAEWQLSEGPAS